MPRLEPHHAALGGEALERCDGARLEQQRRSIGETHALCALRRGHAGALDEHRAVLTERDHGRAGGGGRSANTRTAISATHANDAASASTSRAGRSVRRRRSPGPRAASFARARSTTRSSSRSASCR
ncbi:MAG: hypothetical protein U0271_26115 [Polyangiaceae bacterium]